MHPNAQLVERLYSALSRHACQDMAVCYSADATFRDIAFNLQGRKKIGAMWGMVCDTDIEVTFQVVQADDESAVACIVDDYTFSETGRRVRNVIESKFRFGNGLIIEHVDSCDARLWAAMAMGGVSGFFAGRFRLLRRWKAAQLLRDYEAKHPS